MTSLIIIFGALTFLAGLVIIINPATIFGAVHTHIEKIELQILAVALRLVLGTLLIHQAGISKYPLAMEIIGWISVAAALILAVIGRDRFKRLMTWALTIAKPYGRIGGVAAACFGLFLIYAFI